MTAPPVLALTALVVALAMPVSPALARKSPAPNSGKPGAPCKRVGLKGPDPGPGTGLDSTSLGRAAPAPYEIGGPTNPEDASGPTHRVMIFVHGGGWSTVGRKAMRSQRDVAARWRGAGWQTVSISYRACRKSVGDVLRFYDLVRKRVGPWVPICLRGESAGGHLALMVAARRADVSCVIALASPTDLRSVRAQGRIEVQSASAPAELLENSARVSNIAVSVFGRRRQRTYSPVAYAARINARLLLATAANDVVIPQGQAQALANAVTAARPGAHVDTMRLEAGGDAFVHGGATASAKRDFDSHATSLVAPFGRAPEDAGEPEPQRESNPLSNFLNSIFGGIFGPRR